MPLDPYAIPDVLPTEGGWFVTNGSKAVGPVDLELLSRGILADKVPQESFVRHITWKMWVPVLDIRAKLLQGSADEEEETVPLSDRISQTSPEDALAFAETLSAALMLLLGAAVMMTRSSVGFIHQILGKDGEENQVACSHGPRSKDVAPSTIEAGDPILAEALADRIVVTEPIPGLAGQKLLQRLETLGKSPPPTAALMLPIVGEGGLFGTLELGSNEGYSSRDVAHAHALVQAFERRMTEMKWV